VGGRWRCAIAWPGWANSRTREEGCGIKSLDDRVARRAVSEHAAPMATRNRRRRGQDRTAGARRLSSAARPVGCVACLTPRAAPSRSPRRPRLRRSRTSGRVSADGLSARGVAQVERLLSQPASSRLYGDDASAMREELCQVPELLMEPGRVTAATATPECARTFSVASLSSEPASPFRRPRTSGRSNSHFSTSLRPCTHFRRVILGTRVQ
jgi:hypothetical protein